MTREKVRARTRELAILAGRSADDISQLDYERAKRELTGESNIDRQEAVLNGGQSTPSVVHQIRDSLRRTPRDEA
jgi:hypothetical protein